MSRTIAARKRDVHARLLQVDKVALHKAIDYLERDEWNAETASDYIVQAMLPIQSVFFRKGLAGDYDAAIKCVRYLFPGCDWTIDQGGADINVNGKDYGYEDSRPNVALVRCVLDAVMEYE